MQKAKAAGRRALALCTIISCAILLMAGVLLYRVIEQSSGAESEVVHTLEVQKALSELLNDLRSAESGQRGYLLIGDAAFLAPYLRVRDALPARIAALRTLVGDNPEQIQRLEELSKVIAERFDVIAQTLAHAERGEQQQVKDILSTQGQPLMTEVRQRIEAMSAAEGQLLVERRARAKALDHRVMTAFITLLVGSALLAFIAFFSLRRYTKLVEATHARLTMSNAELEERVRERTVELEEAIQVANHERGRAESLLVDVNHRVGNNLALVSSFLTMQKRATRNPEAARVLTAAMARVQAIASAQRNLRLGKDFATVDISDVLGAVIDDIAAGLPSGDTIVIEHSIEPLEINSRDAVSLGVLTSELVMNAVKHAFPSGTSGTVNVVFASEEGTGCYLEVSDDGDGWIEKESEPSDGLGTKIIDMVALQFGGRVDHRPRCEGVARPGSRVRIYLAKLALVQPAG